MKSRVCLAIILLTFVIMTMAISSTPTAADGFIATVSREVRTVETTSQPRLDQYNPGARDPFWYLLGDSGGAFTGTDGTQLVFSIDMGTAQPATIGKIRWSTRLDARPEEFRESVSTPAGIEISLSPRDYKLGSNALYLWEEVHRGRQVIFRLFNLIPLGHKSSTVVRNEFVQFGVEECEIPLNQRDDLSMEAWYQKVGIAGRPVHPGRTLDNLQNEQNDKLKDGVTAQVNEALAKMQAQIDQRALEAQKSATFKLTITASKDCVLHVVDQSGKRDRSWPIKAGKTVVSIMVEGGDALTYYVDGNQPKTVTEPNITEEVR